MRFGAPVINCTRLRNDRLESDCPQRHFGDRDARPGAFGASGSRRTVTTMRLWSLHPKYLDPRGLVALWREGLLAQAVLCGKTSGYVHHPQLARFKERPDPVGLVAEYLRAVHQESVNRGYRFAAERIGSSRNSGHLSVTHRQIEFEWHHLLRKLTTRNPQWRARLANVNRPEPHPLFRIVPGDIAEWEKGDAPRRIAAK